jgi:hypothetical protein
MSKATAKRSANAATAAKKTATAKTTRKTKADYHSTAPSISSVLKSCGLGAIDKLAVSFDTKGLTDFVLIQFYVNNALPEKGGYLAKLLEDSHSIRWSHPVDSFLSMMKHFCSIMESKYL